jgi:hypothetical protein
MFGGPTGPAATSGAPEGITVGWTGWDAGFEATTGFEERGLRASRLTVCRDFADRRGASTVMVGNAAGLAGELWGSSARLATSGPDCARAEAVYKSPGINVPNDTAIKAS